MIEWVRRAADLHDELTDLADIDSRDPRWWLVAGGAALPWHRHASYIVSDAEPASDTFIGHCSAAPTDVIADAIARAHAARAGLRELDGELPGQPLSVTIRRTAIGAVAQPSALDVAAFAIGDRIVHARLAAEISDEQALSAELAAVLAGNRTAPADSGGATPFVTVALGDEPIETARHGHRRGWTTNGVSSGPWLGLGRANDLELVSTCHMIVDGFGHAWLAARIADHTRRLRTRAPATVVTHAPPLAAIATAFPLGVAWRPLPSPSPRALPLAYALGCLLHRAARRPDARFSPTFQIPVAPGHPTDPLRRRHRIVPAIVSVRFDAGVAEPFDAFAARAREVLGREARGSELAASLLAAAQAVPAPLAWKRRAVGADRPRWLEPVADLIGGRGCVSRLHVDAAMPPSCAVSSPARLATLADPLGGCVVTTIDDGERAAITVCGTGLAGTHCDAGELLDRLLDQLRTPVA